MKKWVLRILNGLSAIIIVLAVLVLMRSVFTASGEVPMLGGYGFLRVLSGSMEPTIPTNSMIVIHEENATALVEGDIITFYSSDPDLGGSLNTHRIVGIETDASSGQPIFTTKGDANSINDEQKVPASDVVGKVVLISGILGLIVSLFSNPLIFVPCILVPIAALLIYEIIGAVKATSEIAQAEDERALRDTVAALRLKKELEAKKAAEANETGAVDAEGDAEAAESPAVDAASCATEQDEPASVEQDKPADADQD